MRASIRTLVTVSLISFSMAVSGPAMAFGSDADDKLKDAVAAIEKKDFKAAIEHLEEVLENEEKNADALNYMGYSYRKLGDYHRAVNYYLAALDSNPNHKGAHEYLGQAYLALKQPTKAKIHLDSLSKLCGPSCEEYKELKEAYDAYQAANKQS